MHMRDHILSGHKHQNGRLERHLASYHQSINAKLLDGVSIQAVDVLEHGEETKGNDIRPLFVELDE